LQGTEHQNSRGEGRQRRVATVESPALQGTEITREAHLLRKRRVTEEEKKKKVSQRTKEGGRQVAVGSNRKGPVEQGAEIGGDQEVVAEQPLESPGLPREGRESHRPELEPKRSW